MLALLFNLGGERYALSCEHLVEVVPLVRFRKIPHAPAYVLGLFNYRGQVTPALDLGVLIGGEACRDHLSTRMMVVRYTDPHGEGEERTLGLVGERVTETKRLSPEDLSPVGLAVPESQYFQRVIVGKDELAQLFEPQQLVAFEVHELLFGQGAGEPPEKEQDGSQIH